MKCFECKKNGLSSNMRYVETVHGDVRSNAVSGPESDALYEIWQCEFCGVEQKVDLDSADDAADVVGEDDVFPEEYFQNDY